MACLISSTTFSISARMSAFFFDAVPVAVK
jgi:hypothetical protein